MFLMKPIVKTHTLLAQYVGVEYAAASQINVDKFTMPSPSVRPSLNNDRKIIYKKTGIMSFMF